MDNWICKVLVRLENRKGKVIDVMIMCQFWMEDFEIFFDKHSI